MTRVLESARVGMTDRLAVWLPKLLPGAHLSPNGDQKRIPALVAKDKRQMRADVCLGLLADPAVRARTYPFTLAHVFLELRWCKRWRWRKCYLPEDPSNAAYALKAAVDGLIDAGLLPDDSLQYLHTLSTRVVRVDTREEEGLYIVISEIERDG